jgi:flagellar motility protein MotE (MotC chaperone)
MIARPSLLMLTAAAAAIATAANAVSAASPEKPAAQQEQTRLGAAIEEDLGARDAAAARRKRALDLREQAAKATEARLKAEVETQQQAKAASPPGPQSAKAQEQDDQYEDLARIYQAMKPARAAIIFEQLDMDVQMRVAQRMRERNTGLILAAMTPKGAAALSMALARRAPPRPAAPTRTARK